ncbi:MAG: hypothetical protein HWN66_07265 [Candidatus Helarchaeota archaeon]|nr:hypothetical protein [Candidatus Helarchaeota archaeon]
MLPNYIPGKVNVVVNIEEIPAVGETFSFWIGKIVEIILMGPVFVIIYYVLMKNLLGKIDLGQGRNKQYVYLLELMVVMLVMMVVVGHVVHLMFDYANWVYREVSPGLGYDTDPLFLFLYHSDEWVGHHLIHVGFFGFVVLALIGETLIKDRRNMKWYEIVFVVPLGIGLFVMSGYATYEGQCAWLLMVLSAILLAIEVVVILWKKINPLKYPILFASIIGSAIVIGYYIYYISIFGTLPFYPFVPQ